MIACKMPTPPANQAMDSLPLRGFVRVEDALTGRTIVEGPNMITNLGRFAVAKMIGGTIAGVTVPIIRKMKLGNGNAPNGIAIAPTEEAENLQNVISIVDPIAAAVIVQNPLSVIFSSIFSAANADFSNPAFPANTFSEIGLFTQDETSGLVAIKVTDSQPFSPAVPNVYRILWSIYV